MPFRFNGYVNTAWLQTFFRLTSIWWQTCQDRIGPHNYVTSGHKIISRNSLIGESVVFVEIRSRTSYHLIFGMLSSSLCRQWLDYVLLFFQITQTWFVIIHMVHVSVLNHTTHLYFVSLSTLWLLLLSVQWCGCIHSRVWEYTENNFVFLFL